MVCKGNVSHFYFFIFLRYGFISYLEFLLLSPRWIRDHSSVSEAELSET